MTEAAASNPSSGFATDYLPLASFLLSHGHQPTLTCTGGHNILFSFESNVAGDVDAFRNKTARVEPASYDAARIELRKRMDALSGRGGVR